MSHFINERTKMFLMSVDKLYSRISQFIGTDAKMLWKRKWRMVVSSRAVMSMIMIIIMMFVNDSERDL